MLCTEFGHIPCGKMGGICAEKSKRATLSSPTFLLASESVVSTYYTLWPHREIRRPGNPLFQVL